MTTATAAHDRGRHRTGHDTPGHADAAAGACHGARTVRAPAGSPPRRAGRPGPAPAIPERAPLTEAELRELTSPTPLTGLPSP
ncbi:hypothetical protein J7I94_04945 [Streptomyces sp. ISL-12]|uniref:hypothetical protein n=1 Tax=Streptomyces sp. ISL-12 TaxID=2819177 RepID=UPI001BE7278B|nr:hypothetical protein [Streptomyces sp. ISL-12]MBT2409907.1 hypothetical protein [Streptomyces sp. ISL-12]